MEIEGKRPGWVIRFTLAVASSAALIDPAAASPTVVAVVSDPATWFESTVTAIANLQVSVDNDVQIFVNAVELALEGTLSTANFSNGIHHGLLIDSTGNVTNGGDAFDSFTDPFPSGNWVGGGDNEVILAVRNLSGGDTGGFSFRLDVATALVPGPASLLLLIPGVVGLGALHLRCRRLNGRCSVRAST